MRLPFHRIDTPPFPSLSPSPCPFFPPLFRHFAWLGCPFPKIGSSWAQVNIESFRSEEKLSGDFKLSFNSDIGNVDAVQGDAAANVTMQTDAAVYMLVLEGGMGFLGGRRFANSGVLHLRYSLKRSKVWQPEFFLQGDYAKSRRLDGRFLAGESI